MRDNIVKFAILLILLFSTLCSGQAVKIPLNSTIELSWISPPDTDVVAFEAIFVKSHLDWVSTGDTIWYYIDNWFDKGNDTTGVTTVNLKLPLGKGFAQIRAIDRNENKSYFNFVPALYEVYDEKPTPPSYIKLKVIH